MHFRSWDTRSLKCTGTPARRPYETSDMYVYMQWYAAWASLNPGGERDRYMTGIH